MSRLRPLHLLLTLALLPLASAVRADPPTPLSLGRLMTPQDFEAYATGKTLAYADQGVVWGRETYLAGRQVMWRAVGQDCELGHWWSEGEAVCFGYETEEVPQCWHFYEGERGLIAQFLNDPASPPSVAMEEPDAVPCPGPEIGS